MYYIYNIRWKDITPCCCHLDRNSILLLFVDNNALAVGGVRALGEHDAIKATIILVLMEESHLVSFSDHNAHSISLADFANIFQPSLFLRNVRLACHCPPQSCKQGLLASLVEECSIIANEDSFTELRNGATVLTLRIQHLSSTCETDGALPEAIFVKVWSVPVGRKVTFVVVYLVVYSTLYKKKRNGTAICQAWQNGSQSLKQVKFNVVHLTFDLTVSLLVRHEQAMHIGITQAVFVSEVLTLELLAISNSIFYCPVLHFEQLVIKEKESIHVQTAISTLRKVMP